MSVIRTQLFGEVEHISLHYIDAAADKRSRSQALTFVCS